MIPFIERFGWTHRQAMEDNPPDLLEEMAERWYWEDHWTQVKEEKDARKAEAMRRRVG